MATRLRPSTSNGHDLIGFRLRIDLLTYVEFWHSFSHYPSLLSYVSFLCNFPPITLEEILLMPLVTAVHLVVYGCEAVPEFPQLGS